MREIPTWDQYYLHICQVVAARSKDPNTQIGCVIIGPNHEIRSTGYNSFPRGIRDDVPERLVRPTKYLWIEHAERNAICNAARAGTATEGCTIYVEIMPCMDCARAVVQAGIIQVVVSAERMAQYSSEYYNEHFGMVGSAVQRGEGYGSARLATLESLSSCNPSLPRLSGLVSAASSCVDTTIEAAVAPAAAERRPPNAYP